MEGTRINKNSSTSFFDVLKVALSSQALKTLEFLSKVCRPDPHLCRPKAHLCRPKGHLCQPKAALCRPVFGPSARFAYLEGDMPFSSLRSHPHDGSKCRSFSRTIRGIRISPAALRLSRFADHLEGDRTPAKRLRLSRNCTGRYTLKPPVLPLGAGVRPNRNKESPDVQCSQ
jgi:hypothetical protein